MVLWRWWSGTPRMLYVIPGGGLSYAGSSIIGAIAQVRNGFILCLQLLTDCLDRFALLVGGGGHSLRKRLDNFP